MSTAPHALSSALIDPKPAPAEAWVDHLKGSIVRDWRPGEFDFETLVFTPDPDNPRTSAGYCVRSGCTTLLPRAAVCHSCRTDHKRSGTALSLNEWALQADPPVRFEAKVGCVVGGCKRGHGGKGLCHSHHARFTKWAKKQVSATDVASWIAAVDPGPFPPLPRCRAGACPRDTTRKNGLCHSHQAAYRKWERGGGVPGLPVDADTWVRTTREPPADRSLTTYSRSAAVPFGLLPEPVRWEFLYAVQQRDLGGGVLSTSDLRGTYRALLRRGCTSVVGQDLLGMTTDNASRAGMLNEWQRHIEDAQRTWSGTDTRDPRIIYLRDLELTQSTLPVGPNAKVDLSPIRAVWLAQSYESWIRSAPRGRQDVGYLLHMVVLIDEILTARGTPRDALGRPDMDAIVSGIRKRWHLDHTQRRQIGLLNRFVAHCRRDEALHEYWGDIPSTFAVDLAKHRPRGTKSRTRDGDDAFRFVPQPIIDHLMDHLTLVQRRTPYLTAEARVLLFLQERCGRRTTETVRLKDDCISYDNQGSPYLEWERCKPPYTMGKRLPIHQETHDVIRKWQQIKRDHAVESQWLFPSMHRPGVDKPWNSTYLQARVQDLVAAVLEKAPYEGPAEGPEGNLIHFDLTKLDAYSFRHAFAQRFADATDAEGRSTTPPDVLQEYMGHSSFNTTMAYFKVTARRRKKALEAVAPRRLNIHGEVVSADRERDGFTKVAVSLGHCTEPQNVAAGGHGCMVDHACESCPFFLVDPLERDGMEAKRHALRVKLERARVINTQQHLLDHYEARIKDTSTIIDGIDAYIDGLPEHEREAIREAIGRMADIRRRATAARHIDLRQLLEPSHDH